jgi:hypothetical protein
MTAHAHPSKYDTTPSYTVALDGRKELLLGDQLAAEDSVSVNAGEFNFAIPVELFGPVFEWLFRSAWLA